MLILAVAGSGCGPPASGPGTPAPPSTLGTELGADRISWMSHHRSSDPTFRDVAFAAGRVAGFAMHLGDGGIAESAALTVAVKEIPADARLVFDSRKYVSSTDVDDQCDLLQYQSTQLGRVLPEDPMGVIIIRLGRLTDNGFEPYDPHHVTTISIVATGTLNDVPAEC